jgi:hypothetical protein
MTLSNSAGTPGINATADDEVGSGAFLAVLKEGERMAYSLAWTAREAAGSPWLPAKRP